MKRTILFIFFMVAFIVARGDAQESGKAGELDWILDNGLLRISGTGDMPSYYSEKELPWYRYIDYVYEVEISEGVTNIGEGAFRDCMKLTSVKIPNSVTTIGKEAFEWCIKLRHIDIPNSVISIGEGAFSDSRIATINFPANLSTIEKYTFEGCRDIISMVIPHGVKVIGFGAFAQCTSLNSLSIPNSVETIYDQAFISCHDLKVVDIPHGVKSIGSKAFYYCSRLSELTIPKSVQSIGAEAFNDENIQKIKVSWSTPLALSANDYVFNRLAIKNCKLIVPDGTLEAYKNAEVWKDFGIIAEEGSEVVSVSLNETSITIDHNATFQLVATINPANAADKSVSWESEKSYIASVDENGLVTSGIFTGSTIITVATTDGKKYASCLVNVEKLNTSVAVESVSLNAASADLVVNETLQLVATIYPYNATDQSVLWTSNVPGIASVDENGNVKANNPGEAIITVSTMDGNKNASCKVYVSATEIPVLNVYLNSTSEQLSVNETFQLEATLHPLNSTDKTLQWISSEPGIATVNENGLVTAVKSGMAIITVITNSGHRKSECLITVTGSVSNDQIQSDLATLFTDKNGILLSLRKNAAVRVVSLVGQMLYNQTLSQGNHHINLNKGVYVVIVENQIFKVVVSK